LGTIRNVLGREVLDSRGRPTVEAEVILEGGAFGRAIAPSGASTGIHEALELRDSKPQRFSGFGVQAAVRNINRTIAKEILQAIYASQEEFDRALIELDGTPNKSRLGANAILACSLAYAHASAAEAGVPLWKHLGRLSGQPATMPLPMINIISGGLHAGRQLEFQDFLVVPYGARSIMEALEWTHEIYKAALVTCVRSAGYNPQLVADEGGIGPNLPGNTAAVKILRDCLKGIGLGNEAVGIALDVASSHFYEDGLYHMEGKRLGARQMVDYLERLVDKFPIISIEDGLAEDDWAGWELLTERLGKRIQLLGDDLFVTNAQRLSRGIEAGVANAVLVKLNQIGTLTETLETVKLARENGYHSIISARSGETEDCTMSDLAVGVNGRQIKIGSITRSSRLAKYNQLLRISENPQVKHWKKTGWAWNMVPERIKSHK